MPSRPKSKRTSSLPVVVKDHKQVATRPVMLLVLGPHRSGTSLTARMLECLGAENSRNQLPPQRDNPSGFFEDSDVYDFGESVFLPKLQRRWDSVSPTDWSVLSKSDRSRLGLQALEIIRRNYPLSNPLSVLKEPRINNTLPFWLSLLEHAGFDVRVVCAVRDPVSVARSLEKRNHFSLAYGGMIYLSAWLSILPHLQERQVSFVQFDEIFATPGKVLAKVADRLGLPLPADFDQRVHQFSSEHLDPSLRHSTLPREDVMLEPDLPPIVAELYRVLLDAAQSQNIRKTAKFLTYAERQVESLAPLLSDYDAKQARIASLQAESEAATTECTRLQSQLDVSTHQNHAALVAERDALAARVSSVESEHSSLSTLHSALAARLSSLESEYSSLSTVHSSLVAERDDLATRHSPLVTALEQLQAEHSSLSTLHSALAARLSSLESEYSSLSTVHSSLVAERDALTQERDQLNAERDGLVTEREALHSERSDLATRHQQLATALESLQSQHSSLIAERDDLATRVTALESELADGSYELQTKLLAERHSLSRTIKERDEAARERDQFAARLIKLEREYHALTKSEHSLKISHRRLEERFSRASAALTLLKNAQDEATSLRSSLASLQAEKDHVVEDRNRLTTRVSSLESEHSDLVTRHTSLVSSQESLVAELDGSEANLRSALQDNKALADNIAARFNELAILAKTIAEKDDTLKQVQQDASYRGAHGCSIEKVFFADAREHPPHNHLNITLNSVQVGNSHWDALHMRLVEHHGQPGLAIFEPQSGGTPLKKWSRSGEETGIPYYLLVPGDSNGRRLLNESDGADFYFLEFLVRALEAELSKSESVSDTPTARRATLQAWTMRAAILRQILNQAGQAFFRHGESQTRMSAEASAPRNVEITLPDCYFSGRFFPEVAFTWKPEQGTLVFASKDNPSPVFVGTEALRNSALGAALEVRFESSSAAVRPEQETPVTKDDISLARAIAERLPHFLKPLPAPMQRRARALNRSFLGETNIRFRRLAKGLGT